MKFSQLSHLVVLVALGCDGKLVVERDAPAGDLGTVDIGENGGAAAISPNAGKLGESCIPARLVTGPDGNPAHATIQTLTRCDTGLSCNASGQCVAAPDCQNNSGTCVLRRSAVDQEIYDAEEPTGIVALAATDSHVYWLEYGTRDASGTYQHDGSLLSYSFADRTTTTVVSGLDGPTHLGLTTTHAYIGTDGTPDDYRMFHAQVLRVPLAGEGAQLVHEDVFLGSGIGYLWAAAGDQMSWSTGSNVYSISADATAVPTLLLDESVESRGIYELASDEQNLFYLSPNGSDLRVMRVPLTNGAPLQVGTCVGGNLALHDESMFVMAIAAKRTDTTPPQGLLLLRAPKSGGEFQLVRALGSGMNSDSLQVVGDRFFFGAGDRVRDREGVEGPVSRVLTAKFTDFTPPQLLVEWPHANHHFLWTGTAHGVYWTDGKTIYDQPLPAR